MICFFFLLFFFSITVFSQSLTREDKFQNIDEFSKTIINKNIFRSGSIFILSTKGESNTYSLTDQPIRELQLESFDHFLRVLSFYRYREEISEQVIKDIGKVLRKERIEFPIKSRLHIDQVLSNQSGLVDFSGKDFQLSELRKNPLGFSNYFFGLGGSYSTEKLIIKKFLDVHYSEKELGWIYYKNLLSMEGINKNESEFFLPVLDLEKILNYLSAEAGIEGRFFWQKAMQKQDFFTELGFPGTGLGFHEYFLPGKTAFIMTFLEKDKSYFFLAFPEEKTILFFFTPDSYKSAELFLSEFSNFFFKAKEIKLDEDRVNLSYSELAGDYVDSFANLNGLNRWFSVQKKIRIIINKDNSLNIKAKDLFSADEEYIPLNQTLFEKVGGGSYLLFHISKEGKIQGFSFSGIFRGSYRTLQESETLEHRTKIGFYFVSFFTLVFTLLLISLFVNKFIFFTVLSSDIKKIRFGLLALSIMQISFEVIFYILIRNESNEISKFGSGFLNTFPFILLSCFLLVFYKIIYEAFSAQLNWERVVKYFFFILMYGWYLYYLNSWSQVEL